MYTSIIPPPPSPDECMLITLKQKQLATAASTTDPLRSKISAPKKDKATTYKNFTLTIVNYTLTKFLGSFCGGRGVSEVCAAQFSSETFSLVIVVDQMVLDPVRSPAKIQGRGWLTPIPPSSFVPVSKQ